MTPIVNLHILAKTFTQLSKSAYFDIAFREFSEKTVDAIEHVIQDPTRYPEDVIRQFEQQVWRVMQFVRGSRSNNAPYESQFVLRKALKDWINEDALISSAALQEFNFFLNTEDIWEFIERTLNEFDTQNYKPLVVRIGSPEALKHSPIFCVPLFHELGHFVDNYYEISKTSLLLNVPAAVQKAADPNILKMALNHRQEYFADLFSACYCGTTSKDSLLAIAPNNQDSYTHPATIKRAKMIDDFLTGKPNQMIEVLHKAATARAAKKLEIKFKEPDIAASLNDLITYKINDDSELYGIFPASWNYLHKQLKEHSADWIDDNISDYGIQKTVNDIVEKSIRNYEIRERFVSVANN